MPVDPCVAVATVRFSWRPGGHLQLAHFTAPSSTSYSVQLRHFVHRPRLTPRGSFILQRLCNFAAERVQERRPSSRGRNKKVFSHAPPLNLCRLRGWSSASCPERVLTNKTDGVTLAVLNIIISDSVYNAHAWHCNLPFSFSCHKTDIYKQLCTLHAIFTK